MSVWWLHLSNCEEQMTPIIIALKEKVTLVGSSATCDLVLPAKKVSREHLTITLNTNKVVVKDMGSSTGTFINGKRVSTATVIKDGDKLAIANFSLAFSTKLPKPDSDNSIVGRTTFGWQSFGVFMDELRRSNEPTVLVDKLLRGLVKLLSAERGFVLLRKGGGTQFVLVASYKLSDLSEAAAVSNTLCLAAIKNDRLIAISDSSQDEQYAGAQSLALLEAPRSIVCGPLRVDGEEAFGAIYVDMEKKANKNFDQENLNLFKVVTGLASELIAAQRIQQKLIATKGKLKEFNRITQGDDEFIFGEEPIDAQLNQLIEAAAEQDINVLITGDTGTGKEMVARTLHKKSPRSKGPFVAVNCSAIPRELVEAELFGVHKGAYTGALESRPGRFELANKGTIFLDEIGDLPLTDQVKLLRVLQEKVINPVGSNETKEVDIRIVAATNANLEEKVNDGSFRQDLYYRLNVFRIIVPALRFRINTLERLACHFLSIFSRRFNKKVKGFDKAALRHLREYSWPGNIRELRNVVERAVVIEKGSTISPQSLSFTTEANVVSAGDGDMLLVDLPQEFEAAKAIFTRTFLQRCLDKNEGNIRAVSRDTGIPRNTLYRIMKRLNMRQ